MDQHSNPADAFLSRAVHDTLGAFFEALARPASAPHLAAFAHNYLNSLVAQGFSRDEALGLVAAVGVPGLPSSR